MLQIYLIFGIHNQDNIPIWYMSNPCTDPTSKIIYDLLSQKRQRALYNVPPMRINLVSPYPTFTKQQLEMLRKVEVLKYQSNSTQTNNLTKSQKWATLVSNGSSTYQYYNNNKSSANLTCASDQMIPTLTTACDVPGPPMYLTYDPTVPLYNYTNNRTYSTLNETDTSINKIYTINEFNYVYTKEISFSSIVSTTYEMSLGVIIITDYISSPTTKYSITTPLGIWCKGIYIDAYNQNEELTFSRTNTASRVKISITDIIFNIYYNGQLISNIPISNLTGLNSLVIDPNLTDTQMFFAIQYVGMLTIPEFTLNTQPGYIYNLTLTFNYKYTDEQNQPYDFTQITGIDGGVFCNLSSENQNVYANPLTTVSQTAVISVPPSNYVPGSFVNYNNLLTETTNI
jgi:hypothetical protein